MTILTNPKHPYTKGLLDSIPDINQNKEELYNIKGTVPQIYGDVKGCYFVNRCECCMDKCNLKSPNLIEIADKHFVACYKVGEDYEQ